MLRRLLNCIVLITLFGLPLTSFPRGAAASPPDPAKTEGASSSAPIYGFSASTSQSEQQWEDKFRALPSPQNLRAYMQQLSARPHHVGSPYDLQNAQWILQRF